MVSIIVPVYNAERKLSRCIDSILGQSYKDIELLLIDDGSTDASVDVCKRYIESDKRVRYIYKENGGAATARNRGIIEAKGQYIQFVDSDDYISLDMTKMMVASQTESEADLTICGLISYTSYKCRRVVFGKSENLNMDKFASYVFRYYDQGILHSCWNKLYKRELITSQMNPDYRWGEDFLFNLEYLINVQSVSLVDRPLYYYDCTDYSVTRGKYQRRESSIKGMYKLSLTYLDKIFHSREINSIVSYRYVCDLLVDFRNTNSYFCINSKALTMIIDENAEAICKILPIDNFSQLIIQKEVRLIANKLRKEKIVFALKRSTKNLLNILKGML